MAASSREGVQEHILQVRLRQPDLLYARQGRQAGEEWRGLLVRKTDAENLALREQVQRRESG
jgi:hypothetical protein